MEKDRINHLLSKPSIAATDDLELIEQALEKYPFSQLLHILSAKLAFDLKKEDKDTRLRRAAVYSANRSVLKKVIYEKGFLKNLPPAVPYQELPEFEINGEEEEVAEETNAADEITDSASIFDEVLKNLEKLKSLRQQFQFLETEEPEPVIPEKEKEVEKPAKKKKEKKDKPAAKKARPEKEPEQLEQEKKDMPKEEKITELLEHERVLDEQVNEFFLKEIEETIPPEEPLKVEQKLSQHQIIENFIKEQPSIGAIKKEIEDYDETVTRDLSVKSTTFGDDLVSENLAIILLKQGKKEKAIDIYKKLIWKLPQKKAYFAARIEEIKK